MATTGGPIDHPSYLTRQQHSMGQSTAGANGTSCIRGFPSNVRIRNVSAAVVVAGTSATTGHEAIIYCLGTCTTFNSKGVGTQGTSTTSLGVIALNTQAVGYVGTSGDLNAEINQGSIIFAKNGTDATGVFSLTAELYLDPVQGVWTAGN